MLEDIKQRLIERKKVLEGTTSGKWYVSFLDDSYYMNCIAVTTKPISNHPVLPIEDEDGSIRDSLVATTLLQAPIGKENDFVIVDVDEFDYHDSSKGGCWEEDANFIVFSKNDAEQNIKDLEYLISKLEELS